MHALFDSRAPLVQKIYDSFRCDLGAEAVKIRTAVQDSASESTRVLAMRNSAAIRDQINADFLPRYAYHSTAIEGSLLSPDQVSLALNGKFKPNSESERRDCAAVRGCINGYLYALSVHVNGRTLNQDFVKDVHERTALDIHPANRGIYRTTPVYIRNTATVPAAPESVRDRMADLFVAYSQSELPSAFKALAFHALFESIHPFRDGNGRTGRTILNTMLVDSGLPPIVVPFERKDRYFASLESWQMEGNCLPLLDLAAQLMKEEFARRIRIANITEDKEAQ